MEQPVTLQEFEDLPLLRSTFFHYNLGLEGNAASVLDCNDAGEVKVRHRVATESCCQISQFGSHYWELPSHD